MRLLVYKLAVRLFEHERYEYMLWGGYWLVCVRVAWPCDGQGYMNRAVLGIRW